MNKAIKDLLESWKMHTKSVRPKARLMQELATAQAELEQAGDEVNAVDKRAFFAYRDYALEVWETDELLGHVVAKVLAAAKMAKKASATARNRKLQRRFGGGRAGRTITTGW